MGYYNFFYILKNFYYKYLKKFLKKMLLIFLFIFIILNLIKFTTYKSNAFSTSDDLTFTFKNRTFTLPSWISSYNYAFFVTENKTYSDRCNFTFIIFDNNPDGYITYDSSTVNQYGTNLFSSNNIGFKTKEISSITLSTFQSSIDNNITTSILNQSNTLVTSISRADAFNLPDDKFYLQSTVKIIDTYNNTVVFNPYKNPTLENSINDLENLSFNNFIINANSFSDEIENNDGTLFMLFYNRSLSNPNNTDGLYPIKEKGFTKGSIYTDTNSTPSNYIFTYPIFRTGVFFNIGNTYEIRFAKKIYEVDGSFYYEYLGDRYIFTISSNVTQDYINTLNQQTATSTDEENQQNIENAINNQTQSIDNINNSINDSTVDNSSIQLPTDNTNDPTESAIDNIFTTIYNSFTSGTPQDVIFPIPFTNKNIILQSNYLYNVLQNNNAGWIVFFIQAFWWYIISRFIIKDIMSKIRKIKQGNLDNIQNENIREEML